MASRSSRIRQLAEIYETAGFMDDDPSQFMHRYGTVRDQEVVGFVSASLAFGRRSEILKHIGMFLELAGGESPSDWLLSGGYTGVFPDDGRSFYRIFSNRNMRLMCDGLRRILAEHGTLGRCFEHDYRSGACTRHPGRLASVVAGHFDAGCSPLVAHGETSANKRLNLFLRWMVRDGSPVDLGLWTWYPKSELLMPLDVHVVAVAKAFKLLPENAAADLRQAVKLTDALGRIFPGDPLKGDFALFGYGVSQER